MELVHARCASSKRGSKRFAKIRDQFVAGSTLRVYTGHFLDPADPPFGILANNGVVASKHVGSLEYQQRKQEELRRDGDWAHPQDSAAFETFLAPLEGKSWVTYIQPLPTESSQPQDIVKYLARYLTGSPVSDARLLSCTDGKVAFTARTGKTQRPAGAARRGDPCPHDNHSTARRGSRHTADERNALDEPAGVRARPCPVCGASPLSNNSAQRDCNRQDKIANQK